MRVKSEARRQAILDIAKEAFIKQGFEQTSMSAIAKKLGGSKATLYNYFNSKEAIFLAVMRASISDQLVKAFHGLSEKEGLEVTLSEMGVIYLKSILNPEVTAIRKLALSESERSDIGCFFYENGPKKGWRTVERFIASQVESGNLIPCNTEIATAQLKALLDAELVEPYEFGVIDKPDDEKIEQVVNRAINSFIRLYT
ncbi:HTH-type transcriptional regulator RutR [Vibrio aerogenes CECT 7868]|uniref:HTH-type transcriptional regulator RutR n=1 Tax=Vibrio aerogenes CECT 7868 TaxID=1216006 RepID=A0A1M5ZKV6_9VIBR|nr:TetR/AcrR family transcriptional regulator [Vibrio aerogenes]SHI24870.1 HTH-type transcriptional regulator RutR [Vibrio aerogenes CECT 7868]